MITYIARHDVRAAGSKQPRRKHIMRFTIACLRALSAVALLTGLAATPATLAQPWRPDKPVEIVSPTASGGANDVIARLIQKIAQGDKLVATPINVINRTGGNHTIARAYISQHPGD